PGGGTRAVAASRAAMRTVGGRMSRSRLGFTEPTADPPGASRPLHSIVHFKPGMSIPFRSRVRRPRVRPEEIGTITDPYGPLRFVPFRWLVVSLLPSTLAQQ